MTEGRPLTEGDLRHALYDYRQNITGFPLMVPNIYLWHWESDVLLMSRNNYATEFEIKLTHSDFLADAKKQSKHWRLGNGELDGPTEFYYCCPEGIISVDELPDYAGLMYVALDKYRHRPSWGLSRLCVTVIKKAKRLPFGPLTDEQIIATLKKGINKYWSLFEHTKRGVG